MTTTDGNIVKFVKGSGSDALTMSVIAATSDPASSATATVADDLTVVGGEIGAAAAGDASCPAGTYVSL